MKKGFTKDYSLAPLGRGAKAFTLAEVKEFPSLRGRARVGVGQKAAFTLAEVLITLGVIGVVAAITMPTLIQNYKKQVTVTQLKKAYSEFAQALQKSEAEHGLMETWNFADIETAQERITYFGENYLFPHIKTIKKCIPTSNECWADDVTILNMNVAGELSNTKDTHGSFVTASGYSVYYWLHKTGNGMWYFVDINGLKAPNRVGKDIFAVRADWGTAEKLGVFTPGLSSGDQATREALLTGEGLSSSNDACKTSGYACSGLIIMDGWKISDDYPW